MDKHSGSLPSIGQQRGGSTLIFAVLILALTAIVTLSTFNFVRQELLLSNNESRAKQAFEAAEAGIAEAIAYLGDGPDRDEDGVVDPVFDTNGDDLGDSSTAPVGPGSVLVTTVQDGRIITVTATGYSDDRSSTAVISQKLALADPLPNDPANPMISRGQVVITGSATVHNQEGYSTLWSGGNIELGSNNSTATYVPDMGDPGYPLCMDTPMTCNTVATSNKVTVGLDVIENDASLGNLTADEMFENFFGMTPQAYRNSGLVTIETTGADANADVQEATHEVIWVEGDVAFTNNTTTGCEVAVSGNKFCPPANLKPSILIVNGDASFSGTPNFNGVVYVTGDVMLSGNTTVVGSLLIAGDLSSSGGGSLDVWFNSQVLADLQNAGVRVGMAGTWKDF
ncbi:hypothetical protein Maes01_02767 [Microbulbifer aestuariivivens]|uniref:Type 4 fimbrial biogenesis protein PilX N-terminal domain-containing protein n=1 Tax=Microbulbifer aestuariivivens TaxID=1908308 RepID=A0ABP9WSJ2_9GAMM